MTGLDQIRQDRITKTAQLRELGVNPYPYRYARTHTADQVQRRFDSLDSRQARLAETTLKGS